MSKLTANLNFKVNHLFNNPKSYLDGWIGLWMIDLHSLSTHRWHDISTVEISHCFCLLCTGELQKGLPQSTKKTTTVRLSVHNSFNTDHSGLSESGYLRPHIQNQVPHHFTKWLCKSKDFIHITVATFKPNNIHNSQSLQLENIDITISKLMYRH